MKVVLVNPPNGYNDATYVTPPLGILTLASLVRQYNYEVDIVDLNLEMFADRTLDGKRFYENACQLILEKTPDVVGFTSMCLESHVSLEIAKRLKEKNPSIKTIFGGTHFGTISNELLEDFDFADFVVSGEGENAFLSILNKLTSGALGLPGNVTYRQNGMIQKGILDNKIYSIEDVPFPAYDLVDLDRYFELNPVQLFNFEAGRGCVFKCSFCYSPVHYGDNVGHKSPKLIVWELKKLAKLGAKHIFFVQDNFLNSPRWASEVCRQIANANLPITFECYATFPQLKEQIVDLLAAAKCVGIFTGIDAVSISSQQRMNKPFLKSWKKTSEKLSYCLEKGIKPICAFILEEPNQEKEKIESAIYTALECIRLGCEVHLNTLSIYNKTQLDNISLGKKYHYSKIKPELMFDAPKVAENNHFAKILPQLFPLHSTQNSVEEWELFIVKIFFLSSIVFGLTETAYQFVVKEKKSIWEHLDFVDSGYVEWIRNIERSERRKSVILRFTNHFAKQDLSDTTRSYLNREMAKVYFLNLNSCRIVNLLVNGTKYRANLARFVSLSVFNDIPVNGEMNNQTVALLRASRKIEFYDVPIKLNKILQNLELATESGQFMTLSQVEENVLLKNGWISFVESL